VQVQFCLRAPQRRPREGCLPVGLVLSLRRGHAGPPASSGELTRSRCDHYYASFGIRQQIPAVDCPSLTGEPVNMGTARASHAGRSCGWVSSRADHRARRSASDALQRRCVRAALLAAQRFRNPPGTPITSVRRRRERVHQAAGAMHSVDDVVVGLAGELATPKARARAPTRPMVACIIQDASGVPSVILSGRARVVSSAPAPLLLSPLERGVPHVLR